MVLQLPKTFSIFKYIRYENICLPDFRNWEFILSKLDKKFDKEF